MKMLFLGDVVGRSGRDAVNERLPGLRKDLDLDFVVVNAERFAELPDEVQTVLEEVARVTQAFAFEAGAEADERLLAELRSAGLSINEVDRASFEAASRPMYEVFGERVSGARAWIDTIIALGTRDR